MATKQKDLITNPPHVLTALNWYNTSMLYAQLTIWYCIVHDAYLGTIVSYLIANKWLNIKTAVVYFEPVLPNLKQCNQGRTMHYIIHLSHTMSTNHNSQPEKDVNPDGIMTFFSRICTWINNKINLLHNNKREDTSQVRTVYDNEYLTLTRLRISKDWWTESPSAHH